MSDYAEVMDNVEELVELYITALNAISDISDVRVDYWNNFAKFVRDNAEKLGLNREEVIEDMIKLRKFHETEVYTDSIAEAIQVADTIRSFFKKYPEYRNNT